jgi:cysteinyl-tRNA synthetase
VIFDFIRRVLKRLGFKVTCVQNFTDVDDKIIQRSAERNEAPDVLANRYIADYFDKMDRLNVRRADAYPRVTGHIPQITSFVQRLVEKDLAYPLEGDVYYAVNRFPNYGKLSKQSVKDLVSGARVEVHGGKRDPLDFALWKAAKLGEPAWDSPWGKGRPGWHIECSAMSVDALGETFDIHGGGLDLVFPHHENEIAQSEGATGQPFARYWIHNGFVTINREKMSKSLGNFFTLADIFKKVEPRVVRLMLLSHHYRTPLEFSDDLLDQAARSLQKLEEDLRRVSAVLRAQHGTDAQDGKVLTERIQIFEADLMAALSDDFNAPAAWAAVHSLVGELKVRTATHRSLHTGLMEKALFLVRQVLDEVFGLSLSVSGESEGNDTIESLVNARERARREKDWEEADRLRNELISFGVTLEDTPQGARWWKKT